MLQLDHGVAPDWNWVARNNLSTREHRANVLDDSGLLPGVADVSASDPIQVGENLEHLLRHYYSGILGLGGELGGHVVVLDYFSMKDNLAIIREPFHGWSIATLASAVLNRYPDEFTGVIPHGEAQ